MLAGGLFVLVGGLFVLVGGFVVVLPGPLPLLLPLLLPGFVDPFDGLLEPVLGVVVVMIAPRRLVVGCVSPGPTCVV